MSLKISTGLRNAMLDTGSFKSLMDTCTLKIYAGTEPADADAACANTLICEVFKDNDGITTLTFQSPAVAGVITKTTAEVWAGTNAVSETASFYRLELAADDQLASTIHKRVQSTVALAGGELNLTSLALTMSSVQNIDFYSISLPTL